MLTVTITGSKTVILFYLAFVFLLLGPLPFFLGGRGVMRMRARNISLSLGTEVEILWFGSIAPQISRCESTSKIAGKVGY